MTKDINKQSYIKIIVLKTLGSTPREEGAAMFLPTYGGEQIGTIGGGALEYRATEFAYQLYEDAIFKDEDEVIEKEYHLGPALEQCCGGYVKLGFQLCSLHDNVLAKAKIPLLIFGAGHVGQALYKALSPLPFDVNMFDQRKLTHAHNFCLQDISKILNDNTQSIIYIMTHSHQLDLDLCAEILNLGMFAHLGVIGSKTKAARFQTQLKQRGLSNDQIKRMNCPIGIGGISGKQPEVIAASVIAEALRLREILLQQQNITKVRENV